MDPNGRYLLCRPRGGLNDTLVQFEKCRRHAERFGRTLVIDLTGSGLRLPFGEVFVATGRFGCPLLVWNGQIATALDAVSDVAPSILKGRISSFTTHWDGQSCRTVDDETGLPTSIDLERDHPEALIVHDEGGGGNKGFLVLRRLALAPAIANEVARRLLPLGGDYDSIHVRHSDISTDYRHLFDNCRGLFAGRRLLVCSDSAEVKAYARRTLGDDAAILSVSDIPDTGGAPLHLGETPDPRGMVVDLFSDIVAMARGRVFVFAPLTHSGKRAYFSGLSVLADMLHSQPSAIRNLFAGADPSLVAALFDAPSQPTLPSPRRLVARLDQWRWNFGARWLSTRLFLKNRVLAMLGR